MGGALLNVPLIGAYPLARFDTISIVVVRVDVIASG
jgi:hypothetical protein